MNAELYLRETETGSRIVAGDAVAAGQGQLQPSPETETVDEGYGRQRQRLDPGQYALAVADELQSFFCCDDGGKFVDVGTGDEAAPFPGAAYYFLPAGC